MRNPWVLAQFVVAGVLAVVSLIGIVGLSVFDLAELTFSFQGAVQSYAIFPGLVISLVVNALFMGLRRTDGPGSALRWMLGAEFALIAALLVFHFFVDEAGATFGLAIVTWPVVIALAVAIAVVAAVQRFRPRATQPGPVSSTAR